MLKFELFEMSKSSWLIILTAYMKDFRGKNMKKSVVSDKFSVLLAICDNEKVDVLEKFLKKKKLKNGLIFMGKGTAESQIADIFGFGLSDKLITALLVPRSSQEKTLKELADALRIEIDSYGLAMLLETSSASSVVLDMLGITYQ